MKTLFNRFAIICAVAIAAVSSSGCIVVASDDPVYTCGSYDVGYGRTLEVYDCEEARAYNGSLVEAYWGSTVYAYDGSTVYAYDGSLVYAYAGSTVYAYPGSEVIAYAGSWVYVYSSYARSSQALTAESSDTGADAGSGGDTGDGADRSAAALRSEEAQLVERAERAAGPAKIKADPGAHVEQMSEQQ